MIFMQTAFWVIFSIGIAIPSTLVLGLNLLIKIRSGDNYELNIKSLFIVYTIALASWATFVTCLLM